MTRWSRGLTAALILCLLGTVAAAEAPPPIRIGAFLAISGDADFLGEPEAKTLRLLVDRLNAQGGLLGRPVQLIIYDTAGESDTAVGAARRLVEHDHVHVLIGGSTTSDTMAALPFAEAGPVPLISLAAGFSVTEPVRKWIFAVPHSDVMTVHTIFNDLQRRNIHRIGVIGGSGYYDAACRSSVRQLAAEHALTVVAEESFGRYGPPTDVVPHLKRIKAADAQAIVGCGFGESTIMIARDYRALGLTGMLFYFTQGIGSGRFIKGAGAAAEGIRLPVSSVIVGDRLRADDPQRAVVLAYRTAYANAYAETVSSFGGHAHDALMLAADAIRRANGTDAAAVREALEQTKGFVGVGGVYTLSPADHRGVTMDMLTLVEVRDGAWQPVDVR